jgi:hypothetical protein
MLPVPIIVHARALFSLMTDADMAMVSIESGLRDER